MEIFWIINNFLLDYHIYVLEYIDISEPLYLSILYSLFFLLLVKIIEIKMPQHIMIYIKIFIFIPGTIVHELMHYIASLALNGKPVRFTIFPKFEKDRIVLGSVSNSNITWYNSFVIGFAPLFTLWVLIIYADNYMDLVSNIYFSILQLYLFFILVINSVPSKQDIHVAFVYMVPGLILFFILLLLFMIYFEIYNVAGFLHFDRVYSGYYPDFIKPGITYIKSYITD